MSLFLIYLETGKPAPRPLIKTPLVCLDLKIAFEGRSKPANYSMAITDGVSSERFLRTGSKAVDRLGEELRRAFFAFVRERLSQDARPAFVFEWFDGSVESVRIDWTKRRALSVEEMEKQFTALARSDLIEISP